MPEDRVPGGPLLVLAQVLRGERQGVLPARDDGDVVAAQDHGDDGNGTDVPGQLRDARPRAGERTDNRPLEPFVHAKDEPPHVPAAGPPARRARLVERLRGHTGHRALQVAHHRADSVAVDVDDGNPGQGGQPFDAREDLPVLAGTAGPRLRLVIRVTAPFRVRFQERPPEGLLEHRGVAHQAVVVGFEQRALLHGGGQQLAAPRVRGAPLDARGQRERLLPVVLRTAGSLPEGDGGQRGVLGALEEGDLGETRSRRRAVHGAPRRQLVDPLKVPLGDPGPRDLSEHAAHVHAGGVGQRAPGDFADHPPGVLFGRDGEEHLARGHRHPTGSRADRAPGVLPGQGGHCVAHPGVQTGQQGGSAHGVAEAGGIEDEPLVAVRLDHHQILTSWHSALHCLACVLVHW